jgi:hypothetical protein
MSFRSRLITLVVEPVSHQAGPSKLSRPALAPTLAQLRSYATHKEAPRKNGPSASATAAQEAYVYGTTTGPRVKSTFEGTERVGPFPLGVGSSGRDQTWKSWRELTLGGKREYIPLNGWHGQVADMGVVGRTVRQSGNLGIILFGSGLLIVLTLSLTTELFATNSPGVLYSQAVDKIRKSNAVSSRHAYEHADPERVQIDLGGSSIPTSYLHSRSPTPLEPPPPLEVQLPSYIAR